MEMMIKKNGWVGPPIILGVLLLVCFLAGEVRAYSYGPACQWLRLRGQVTLPMDISVKKPLVFSVTYQLPGMANPATLLTNFPLAQKEFYFILSGFREEVGPAIFVPPMFFFAKKIVFRFYAKSADGKWASDFGEKVYVPQNIPRLDIPANKNKEYLCKTQMDLGSLVLKRISR